MEVTTYDSVESQNPHEWNVEKVVTFVRSLGPPECFQSAGDQVYHHMCEFKDNSSDVCARTVSQCHRQTTVVHLDDTYDTF